MSIITNEDAVLIVLNLYKNINSLNSKFIYNYIIDNKIKIIGGQTPLRTISSTCTRLFKKEKIKRAIFNGNSSSSSVYYYYI